MSQSPSDPRGKKPYARDRRAPRSRTGSVGWVKGLLGRPLAVERRGLQVHLTLVDRRRPPEVIEAEDLQQLRDELRTRLLGHQLHHAAAVMRHLGAVHDQLGRKGWVSVEALTSSVLGRALVQAQMLASEETSPRLDQLIERLQLLKVAATVREDRAARPAPQPIVDVETTPMPAAPERDLREVDLRTDVEVSEATTEDFDAMERGWVDTVSPGTPEGAPSPGAPAASAPALDDKN